MLNYSKVIVFGYPFLSGFISTLLVSIIIVVLSSLMMRGQPDHSPNRSLDAVTPTDAMAPALSPPILPTPDAPKGPLGLGGEGKDDASTYPGFGDEPTRSPMVIPTNTPRPTTPTFTATPFIPTNTPESFTEETATIPLTITMSIIEPAIEPTTAIPDVPPTEAVQIPPLAPDAGGNLSLGIGLDIPAWEAIQGKPTGENTLGYVYKDGAFIIIPQKNNNIWHLERVWNEREASPIDDARKVARGFIPEDYTFLGSQQTPPLVERYHSPWLATRFPPEMDWDGGAPGDFVITYSINQDNHVISFIITTGNNP